MAKNVREVKIVYATLMESLATSSKGKTSKVNKLVEGASTVVRKPVKDVKDEQIIEYNDSKARIHKLMNYKKK